MTQPARRPKYFSAILYSTLLSAMLCLISAAFMDAGRTWCIALVSLVLPAMVSWATMTADDVFNPLAVFAAFFACYNGLLLMRLSQVEVQLLLQYPVSFETRDYYLASLLSAISAITIATIWLWMSASVCRRDSRAKWQDSERSLHYLAGFFGVLVGAGAKLVEVWQTGGIIQFLAVSRVERLSVGYERPVNLPSLPFVLAGLSLMAYAAGPRFLRAKLLQASFALWCVIAILQGDRGVILRVAFAVGCVWVTCRKERLRLRFSSCTLLVVLYLASAVFGQLRAYIPLLAMNGMSIKDIAPQAGDAISLDTVMPEHTEFAGPYLSLLNAVSGDSPMLHGSSYAQSLTQVIPRALYHGEKPVSLSQTHDLQMSPGLGIAAGWGFSPIAEAYMNFGWWGVPIVMAGWTLLFIGINKLRNRRPLGLMIASALVSQAVNVNRIDFVDVYVNIVHCTVAAIIVYSFAVVMRHGNFCRS